MTLIPLEDDGKTISGRFRKAPKFAFLDEGQIIVQDNPHKRDKSAVFFEYFATLNIDTLYVKNLGLRTFEKLSQMGVEVYRIDDAVTRFNRITPQHLVRIDASNAAELCTLGHHKKDA